MSEKDYLANLKLTPDDKLDHGVLGMKWGQHNSGSGSPSLQTFGSLADAAHARRTQGIEKVTRKMSKEQIKKLRDREASNLKEAKKNPNFKDDVKAAKRGDGVAAFKATGSEYLLTGYMTSQIEGHFTNHKGEKVSTDYANAVLNQAVKETTRADVAKAAAVTAGMVVLGALSHDDMDDGEDYLAHYGVPGMKWGQRKSESSGTSKNAGPKAPPKAAPANESHGQRYDRLRSQIKTHGPNSLTAEDLNFVNARTEAIAKVNKMHVTSPGWLTDTSKVVLQETTKTLMKDLAVKAGKEYIVKPLIKGK